MNTSKNGRILTVGIDASWMMDGGNPFGGVYQYTQLLVKGLVEHGGISVVAITGPLAKGVFNDLKPNANFSEVELEHACDFSAVVLREKLDVIHCPIQTFYNVTFSAPMILTLHDLQQCRFPEFFSAEELESRRVYYTASAMFAERVIVSYEHVKDDIVKYYGIAPEKIDVCPVGSITPPAVDEKKFPAVRGKYKLPEKYLFYSANTWPHKNHTGLLRALKLVRDKGLDVSLVCTGNKEKFFDEIETLVKELGLDESAIFTGYVTDEEKNLMLKNATLVVIPTLYEAGSFPLMEAMALRAPVICSNVTSLPDTIKDARFTFDPGDTEAMAGLIAKMLTDEKLREENKANSDAARGRDGWDKAVIGFINAYRKAKEDFERDGARISMAARLSAYERLVDRVLEANPKLIKKEAALQENHRLHLDALSKLNRMKDEISGWLVEKDIQASKLNHRISEKTLQIAELERRIEEKEKQKTELERRLLGV
jgi:glycosyltransferase involved in cell wall biosynthesis